MDDFEVLYMKMRGHRNAIAIRNAEMEFTLAMEQEKVCALTKQLEALKSGNYVDGAVLQPC